MTISSTDSSAPVWFITGANTGFGAAIARAALARGARVVATARDPRRISIDGHADAGRSDALLPLHLDVTDQDSVDAAVRDCLDHFGRIDVLVNNAGHGLVGAFEELSEADIDAVLSVNVLGAMRVTRAVLPAMRTRRSGVIIQMSSVGGVVANPGHSLYACSKFALEGWSESMAGELEPLGIRVLIVEPGPFRTEFAGRSMHFAEELSDYAETPAGRLRANFRAQDGNQPNDPERGAALIVDAALDPGAPLRLPLGPEAIARIRAKLGSQLDELDAWQDRASATAFAD